MKPFSAPYSPGQLVSGVAIDVSVVIPMRDAEANVATLCSALQQVMDAERLRYEAIIINDGSSDGTARELAAVVHADSRFAVVEFARGFGQSAAIAAGFRMARGAVIVTIDGHGQDDPGDIPRLVARLNALPGCDVVSGWRKRRDGEGLNAPLSSRFANVVIRRLTACAGVHDFGCALKAYRREVLSDIRLYGETHRFLPAICKWRGARLAEVIIDHRPRISRGGDYIGRSSRLLFDLLTIKFMGGYVTKPIYFFGKLAEWTFVACALAIATTMLQKLGYLTERGESIKINDNVLVIFAMLAVMMGLSLLMMGLLSELLIRIYHESQDRPPYRIRRIWRPADRVSSGSDVPADHVSQQRPIGVPAHS